jgi:microcompartment protein CcmK/EutM
VKLARVVGTVVSTINSPIFEDRTLLLCDLVEPTGEAAGGYLIAVDTVGAGAGELVLILDEGTSARQIVGAAYGPLRTVIVGIVDAVEGPASVAGSGSAGAGESARSDAATGTASTGMAGAKPTARRTRRRVPQG